MIQIFESDFNAGGLIQTVNARNLYEELGVNKKFADWVKVNLKGFQENQDFIIFSPEREKISKGRPLKDYALTLDCAKHICLMSRCEKGKQLRQYLIEVEKQYRLGYAAEPATPQQQTELIPGTPEHFAACYRAYFGEPVQTLPVQQQHPEPLPALPAQQQHTEPVQTGVEYRKPPQDKRSWAKLSKYIARKDIVMKCFEICGVHSEQFDPGYITDENGRWIHCDEHTIYDRKQALAVIQAIYELSIPLGSSKGWRVLAGQYRFKDKLGNRCFTDIPQSAVDSAKQMIQAYILSHGKLI